MSDNAASMLHDLTIDAPAYSPPADPSRPRAKAVTLADVEPRGVDWLWHPYIPLGKVSLLIGDPGVNKSYLALSLAATLSVGAAMPLTHRPTTQPQRTLLLAGEDDLDDTIRPRLDVLGADARMVRAVTGIVTADGESPLTLDSQGVEALAAELASWRPQLVIIDPLMQYLGAGVDAHRANEVRAITTRLKALASDHRCAIMAITHLSKAGGQSALYRALGSIDFVAIARSMLYVAPHPDEPATRRVMAHAKSNLGPMGPSLEFSFTDGRFGWHGPSDLTADDLASPSRVRDNPREEAEDFLRHLFADGQTRPSAEVTKAAEARGIKYKMLLDAYHELGGKPRQVHEPGRKGATGWEWPAPEAIDPIAGAENSDALDAEVGKVNLNVNGSVFTVPGRGRRFLCGGCGSTASWSNDADEPVCARCHPPRAGIEITTG